MKKISILIFIILIIGCSKDKPKDYFEGGFSSMKACISDVKLKSGKTPVVELMNEVKVSGRFDGMKLSQGMWTCEFKQNSTGYPFYGFYSLEKDI